MTFTRETDHGTPAAIATGKSVTLTIDGQSVTLPEGTSIMRAASLLGGSIPKLCATDSVESFGSCRLCLVEVEGRNGYPASCTTPVAEGMVVKTQTEKVVKMRRSVMEFLLINHPLDCPTCDQAGECRLQDYYMKFDRVPSRFKETKVHKDKMVDLGSQVMLDEERCIVCTRCVRFCEEIAGTKELYVQERGDQRRGIQTEVREDLRARERVVEVERGEAVLDLEHFAFGRLAAGRARDGPAGGQVLGQVPELLERDRLDLVRIDGAEALVGRQLDDLFLALPHADEGLVDGPGQVALALGHRQELLAGVRFDESPAGGQLVVEQDGRAGRHAPLAGAGGQEQQGREAAPHVLGDPSTASGVKPPTEPAVPPLTMISFSLSILRRRESSMAIRLLPGQSVFV